MIHATRSTFLYPPDIPSPQKLPKPNRERIVVQSRIFQGGVVSTLEGCTIALENFHKIHGTAIFTYIYPKNQLNVGKYIQSHGSYRFGNSSRIRLVCLSFAKRSKKWWGKRCEYSEGGRGSLISSLSFPKLFFFEKKPRAYCPGIFTARPWKRILDWKTLADPFPWKGPFQTIKLVVRTFWGYMNMLWKPHHVCPALWNPYLAGGFKYFGNFHPETWGRLPIWR